MLLMVSKCVLSFQHPVPAGRAGGATAEGPGGKGAQDYVYKPSYHIVIMLNEDNPLGSE